MKCVWTRWNGIRFLDRGRSILCMDRKRFETFDTRKQWERSKRLSMILRIENVRFLILFRGQKFYTNFFTLATGKWMKGMCFSKPVQRDSDLKFVSMIYNQRNLIILYIFIYQKAHFIKVIKLTDQILELHNKILQRKKFHILNLLIFIKGVSSCSISQRSKIKKTQNHTTSIILES